MRRTVDLYYCDMCGAEAKRYSVVFEDGTQIMDRCSKHGKTLEGLRDQKGDWVPANRHGRTQFKKSSIADLRAAVAQTSKDGVGK